MKNATRCLSICLVLAAAAGPGLSGPVAAGADGDGVDLSVLTSKGFNPRKQTPQQLVGLMKKWLALGAPKPAPPERLKAIYGRLNDESFEVREAASAELEALGPANLDAVVALVAKEKYPETEVRAKFVIAAWRRETASAAVRVRNVVATWKALPAKEQLRTARALVARIQRMPEVMTVPSPSRGRQGFGWQGIGPQAASRMLHIRLRDMLLRQIIDQLNSHGTPEAKAILKGFLAASNRAMVLRTMRLRGSPDVDVDVAADLIRLAEGKDKAIALEALSKLSNWHGTGKHRGEITAMVKRLYAHEDAEIALQAAIISCYSGDGSGFPMLLEATKSPDKAIAMKAIGQLVDCRFSGRGRQVVPLLLPHLKTDDLNLLSRTIETLGNYRSAARDVIPFLYHKDKRIVWRTILALNSMEAPEAVPALKKLQQESTDKVALDYVKEALRRLEHKRK